jgi:hypothetical protein
VIRLFALLAGIAACGDNLALRPRNNLPVDAAADAAADAAPDAPVQLVRVFGYVESYGQAQGGMVVTTLEGEPQSTVTADDGTFYFDVPDGSRLIMRVNPVTLDGALPMIRGVIAHDDLRPRVFYIINADEVAAAGSLGVSFDPTDAIVEVDFRNAEIGGYSVTLTTPADDAITPEFGIVADDQGDSQLGEVTIAGGNGSTLLLGGLAPGAATFAPIVPDDATLPCQPRDANPLPLEAGTVTWFDYECGNGQD